mmetsp:Transcript_1699/g.2031  ORF Transcript_1699/g.2031 Transcript_1699/m.2031 type:complete len:263 (+) Transcript_1699:62-850(+)
MEPPKNLAVFFSRGAFGDCTRHSILAAMEDERVAKIRIYSTCPDTLYEANWNCGCDEDLGKQLKESPNKQKLNIVHLQESDFTGSQEAFTSKVDLNGVDAIISGIGNRQPFLGERIGKDGTKNITTLMKVHHIDRLVAMSSMGISSKLGNDKPCMEWRFEGKIMQFLFSTLCKREYKDLKGVENATKESDVNFLVLRPLGLGEEVKPSGEVFIQEKKFDDVLGPQMAKKDVGTFMVEQALNPTLERKAIVIGGDPKEAHERM